MQVNNQGWQVIPPAEFDRVLRATGGSLRVVRGDGESQPATAGMGLENRESVGLDAGETYAARAWLTATASAEIL